MTALELIGVRKHYGGPPVVQDVSLTVTPGETLAIIGPNGAGKSTLFGVMAGEHRATSGKLILFGKDVTRAGAQRLAHLGISRTFQVARPLPTKTVEQNVIIAELARHSRYRNAFSGVPKVTKSVEEALETVGLAHMHPAIASTLSQGNRKQLELAMALVQRPGILLLDEPTAGMGAEDIPRTIAVLQSLRKQSPALACVITAHDMEVVFALADRVMLLANGKVMVSGTPSDVRDDPLTKEIYLGNSYGGDPQ